MKLKVQYSTLIVRNLEESVAFYRDALGFREGYHVELGAAGRITIMESDGGASVELIENSSDEIGLYSIGTDVDDLDEALRQMARLGIAVTRGPYATTVGRMAFIKDPNGVSICLIQHGETPR